MLRLFGIRPNRLLIALAGVGVLVAGLIVHGPGLIALGGLLIVWAAVTLGSSIGALIGLDLLIRQPDDVRMLAAHEPPVGSLLSEGEKPAVSFTDIYEQTGDADAALR